MKAGIKRPSIILDEEKAFSNIRKMADKAKKSRVRFRPHFKTHQSASIGEFFRKEGVTAITVSSIRMALYFARNGWDDITIAFPVNILEIEEINDLAEKMTLGLLVESEETVLFLDRHLKSSVNAWIKVDAGYRRTGIPAERPGSVVALANAIHASDRLSLKGVLSHSGHSYHATSVEALKAVYQDSVEKLDHVRDILERKGFSGVEISIGDTPTCSIVEDFSDVDEIRPGNFIFYDVMQMLIGSCRWDEIAVTVACPVVAKHEERNEIVIYGGAVHLSKEFGVLPDGTKIFGYVASRTENGWGPIMDNTYVSALSQEHGIVKTDGAFFDQIRIGDLLYILPVHSCLTVNLLKEYRTVDGRLIKTLLP